MAKASDFEGKKQDELFYFVEYSPEEAERVGYSNYSYWGSVIQNFLKHKMAVVCLVLFLFTESFSPSSRWPLASTITQTLITDYFQGVHRAQQRVLVWHRQPGP